MIGDIQKKILELKKQDDVLILAHSYQTEDIIEIADFVGDSYQLSVMAKNTPNKKVVMCGVRFMAETVKILSPEKEVYLANKTAGCPMAEQMDKEYINSIKKQYPDYAVVAYINTTASLKTVCDVCVTSSSAVKIVERIDNDNILFIPDCNLGAFVKEKVPSKNIMLLNGGCPIHAAVTKEEAENALKAHPNAIFLVHPECKNEVVKLSHFAGSTADIMNYVEQSDHKEFIIGTENSIVQHLQFKYPDKKFYMLSKNLICADMRATTLIDLYNCLKGEGGEKIELDEKTIELSRRCIDKMIELGK